MPRSAASASRPASPAPRPASCCPPTKPDAVSLNVRCTGRTAPGGLFPGALVSGAMRSPTAAADPAEPSAGEIGPLLGEFADAALERDFRSATLGRVLPQQRAGLWLWAALMVAFAVPDYLALGPVPQFW